MSRAGSSRAGIEYHAAQVGQPVAPVSPPPNPNFGSPRSPKQTHCYNCQVVLDPGTARDHMRRCFDGQELSGVFTPECFVCGMDLKGLAVKERDLHVGAYQLFATLTYH